MPVRMLATAGTVADCTQAEALIDGIEIDRIETEHLLADRGYDTNAVLSAARDGIGATAEAQSEGGAGV